MAIDRAMTAIDHDLMARVDEACENAAVQLNLQLSIGLGLEDAGNARVVNEHGREIARAEDMPAGEMVNAVLAQVMASQFSGQ